ncbi:MAG: dolichol kinase, partial [Thermoplasmatales archaeon]
LKGKIDSNHFFGLRRYEKNRIGSYLFFGIGILVLLLFFPQQIAVPCILCACFADPIMGEIRYRFGKNQVYIIGFLICMFFFIITWYKSNILIILLISIIGAIGAISGEIKKFWWLDDDFMIQIIPAVLILILWLIMKFNGLDILPEQIIYPSVVT